MKKGRQEHITIHRLSHHSPLVKTKGFCQLKGKMDNSRALVHDGRVLKVISSILIGQDKQECHVDTKEAQGNVGTDNQEKDEKQSQNDKTGLGMEKTVKDKAKSKPESQSSQKVNWSKSKSTQVNPGAKVQEI
ncbi:hypothetical protein Tco_0793344 [Tanacetum coccineum]